MSFYSSQDELLIDDREVTVEFRDSSSAFTESTTRSTTTGSIQLDDLELTSIHYATVSASNFETKTIAVPDMEKAHKVLLTHENDYDPALWYNQTFALDDETGNYPQSETIVELEYYWDGQWQRVDSDKFGDDNRAHLEIEDGQEYRVKVRNLQDDSRVVGTYTGDVDRRHEVVTVTVEQLEEGDAYDVDDGGAGSGDGDYNPGWGCQDPCNDESDYNYRPTASVSASPNDPIVGDSVTFDASGSTDMDGSITSYEWEFSDGTTASGSSVTKTVSSSGAFSATVTVTDDQGLTAKAYQSIYVAENSSTQRGPPLADFEMKPSDPDVGEPVVLDASASSAADGGEIASYEWDVDGDGETDHTGETVEVAFEESGLKAVSLRVVDDVGADASARGTAVVYDPYPPGNGTAGSGGGGSGFFGPVDTSGEGAPGGGQIAVAGLIAAGGVALGRRAGVVPPLMPLAATTVGALATFGTKAGSTAVSAGGRALRALVGVLR